MLDLFIIEEHGEWSEFFLMKQLEREYSNKINSNLIFKREFLELVTHSHWDHNVSENNIIRVYKKNKIFRLYH